MGHIRLVAAAGHGVVTKVRIDWRWDIVLRRRMSMDVVGGLSHVRGHVEFSGVWVDCQRGRGLA
jgi:hypothetical protein